MNKCRICGLINTYKILTSFNIHGRQVIDKKEEFDIYKCRDCGGVFIGNLGKNKLPRSKSSTLSAQTEGLARYSGTDPEKFDSLLPSSVQQVFDTECSDRRAVRISASRNKKYYGEDYFKGSLKGGNWFLKNLIEVSERFSFRRKERLILGYFKHCLSKIRILDIGCGEGKFLESLNNEEFEKKGVEINKMASNVCNKKGLSVIKNDFLDTDFGKEKFETITMWHVLEHLENPVAVLEKIYNLLIDGGILVISTPNTDSFGFRWGRENWFHLDIPRHLVLYNRKSLDNLCQNVGFFIVKLKNEFYDYYTDLFWTVKNNWFKYLIYLFYPIIKLFSRESITFVCRKK